MPGQINSTHNDDQYRQPDEASTYRVYGHILESDDSSVSRKPWKLLYPCLCGQDTPDNPCPCPPHLWWIPEDSIVTQGNSDRKDHNGKQLQFLDISLESKILIEPLRFISAGAKALKRLGNNVSEKRIRELADETGGTPSSDAIIALSPFWVGFFGSLAASLAYDLMKEIFGGKLNWDELSEEEKEKLRGLAPWIDFPS